MFLIEVSAFPSPMIVLFPVDRVGDMRLELSWLALSASILCSLRALDSFGMGEEMDCLWDFDEPDLLPPDVAADDDLFADAPSLDVGTAAPERPDEKSGLNNGLPNDPLRPKTNETPADHHYQNHN